MEPKRHDAELAQANRHPAQRLWIAIARTRGPMAGRVSLGLVMSSAESAAHQIGSIADSFNINAIARPAWTMGSSQRTGLIADVA
jgi:hypothetical protein